LDVAADESSGSGFFSGFLTQVFTRECASELALKKWKFGNWPHCTAPSRSTGPRPAPSLTRLLLHLSNSTGVVDNYEEIYCPAHWKQPDAYARFSDTIEESGASAIIDGFSYSMDKWDNEWLDRNNEEARGEGSRAQGALATSGTTPQCQGERKGTGVTSSEDEFELVMGIFEKSPITRHRSSISYAFCCPSH